MSLYSSRFKSVPVILEYPDRSVDPEGKAKPKTSLAMDDSRDHVLELEARDFLFTREWIGRFFFTLVTAGFGLAVLYGALTLASAVNLGRSPFTAAEWAFVAAAAVIFCAAWDFFTFRAVIGKAKAALVEKERGQGNWKLMDEAEYLKMARVLRAVKERADAVREKQRSDKERIERARFR
jgi:hypothetical protein